MVEQTAFKHNGTTRMITFKDYDNLNRLVYISSYDGNGNVTALVNAGRDERGTPSARFSFER